MTKRQSQPPTSKDRADFAKKHGPLSECGVGLKRDKDGVFVHTHRARSKSYPTADKIPTKTVDFIESTG